jgi:endonuclease YncB( thermonuclease family)
MSCRAISLLVVLAALALGVAGRVSAKAVLPGPIPAEVVEVVDGDTLRVRARIWLDQTVETRVRLTGIDAPELHNSTCDAERQAGERARARLAQLAQSRQVVLEDIRPDKYGGRVLARVRGPNGDLGRDMLADGYALPYSGSNRGKWCRRLAGTDAEFPLTRR